MTVAPSSSSHTSVPPPSTFLRLLPSLALCPRFSVSAQRLPSRQGEYKGPRLLTTCLLPLFLSVSHTTRLSIASACPPLVFRHHRPHHRHHQLASATVKRERWLREKKKFWQRLSQVERSCTDFKVSGVPACAAEARRQRIYAVSLCAVSASTLGRPAYDYRASLQTAPGDRHDDSR